MKIFGKASCIEARKQRQKQLLQESSNLVQHNDTMDVDDDIIEKIIQ